MRRRPVPALATALAAALVVAAGCDGTEASDASDASAEKAAGERETAGQEVALPPDAAGAEAQLAASPRHGEWVMVPAPGDDSVRAWLVYPERDEPAPVVVVVHEIFGLTNWVRAVADRTAAEGFVAIAPDLLSGHGVATEEGGDPEREAAVSAIRALDPNEVHRRLRAVAAWAMDLPAATDRYGIVGFCWGGSTSFAHATRTPDLGASVVFYGSSPDSAALAAIEAPVLGLYGGDDERVNATVPPAERVMGALGKTYEARTYEDAGHGFLRNQDGREGANLAASEAAWPEAMGWFRRHLESGADPEPDGP